MNVNLIFNPEELSPAVVKLIIAKAESEKCAPSEALKLLLNELASQSGFCPDGPEHKEAA